MNKRIAILTDQSGATVREVKLPATARAWPAEIIFKMLDGQMETFKLPNGALPMYRDNGKTETHQYLLKSTNLEVQEQTRNKCLKHTS